MIVKKFILILFVITVFSAYAEFDEAPLSSFFKFLNRECKGKFIIEYNKPENEQKAPKKKVEKSDKGQDEIDDPESLLDDIEDEIDDSPLDFMGFQSQEPEQFSCYVNKIPLGTLISYVCRLADLEYSVKGDKITIKHKRKK